MSMMASRRWVFGDGAFRSCGSVVARSASTAAPRAECWPIQSQSLTSITRATIHPPLIIIVVCMSSFRAHSW